MTEKKKPEISKVSKAGKEVEVELEQYSSDAVIETLWKQYDFLLQSYRASVKGSSDAYQNALKETKKFLEEYQKMVEGFIKDQTKASKELAERFFTYQKNTIEQLGSKNLANDQLIEQLKEIQQLFEDTITTPWKSAAKWTERAGERLEANSKHSLAFIKENREAWQAINDNYLKVLKNNQLAFVRAYEKRTASFYAPFFSSVATKAE